MISFSDNFSRQAADYARHRPSYPEALYEYIASIAPGHRRAWDCGTGNGQAAVGLAAYFQEVIATDASARQIEHAIPHERVRYQVATAGHTEIEDGSADAITIAQAIHWFNHEEFYAEVRRVATPGAIIAAWMYGDAHIDTKIEHVIATYSHDIVGSYWAKEIGYVARDYATLPFPFEEIQAPSFSMEVQWSLGTLLGYLASWSATQKFKESTGRDPLDEVRAELADAWGNAERKRTARWSIQMRVGRV